MGMRFFLFSPSHPCYLLISILQFAVCSLLCSFLVFSLQSQKRKYTSARKSEESERRMLAVTDPITCQGTFPLALLHFPK